MKKVNDNEVDLLLRSLARAARAGSSVTGSTFGSDERVSSEHLDADELNAFAEGLVPEPARARYSQHLADCGRCRNIVITLTQAAGTASRSPLLAQQSNLGFWQKLAAFFSPPVLRYAVPALVITAVIAISLLALRQQRSSEFVAQHQPRSDDTSANEMTPTQSPATISSGETSLVPQQGAQSTPGADSDTTRNNFRDDRSDLARASGSSAGRDATTAPGAKDSQTGQPSDTAQAQPSFAPEPLAAAAPAPPPRPTFSETDKFSKKEEPAERAAQQRQREEYKVQTSDEAEGNRSTTSKTAATPAGPRRVQGLITENRGYGVKNKRDASGDEEIRKVSGRSFRRQGYAWIDTAYDSSRGTINVTRGSEQFRALIADEPAIRVIAEQLGGEVVVVWKGRAYRIR